MKKWYTSVERHGNFILCRGYDETGKSFSWKEEYNPRIFLPSPPNEVSTTPYKSLQGLPLSEYYAGNINETRQFLDSFRDIDNFDYYGMENPVYNYIADKFKGKIEYDHKKLKIAFFDIETESENGFPDIEKTNEEILIVSFHFQGKFYFFSSEKYGVYKAPNDNVIAYSYKTEKEMLIAVVDFWVSKNFDFISGWNSDYFDIPYLINRMKKLLGMEYVKKLSPWGLIKEKKIPYKNKEIISYNIIGVNHIDYLDTFKKFATDDVENYKLDTVGREVLGLPKLDYSQYGALHLLYQQNWQLYGDYNIRDNEILVELEKKKKLFEMIVSLALNAKVNYIDVFRQTVLWDSIFYNHLLEKNIIIPKKERHSFTGKIPGGFVKESRPDFYRWIVSFDLDSLYPHLIMGHNISPETFVGMREIDIDDLVTGNPNNPDILYAKQMNYALAGNGAMFRRDKLGFIPELMLKMYDERKAFKRQMLDKRNWLEANKANLTPEEILEAEDEINKLDVYQNVRKICLNSAYGSLAQIGFRFFKPELASAITMTGQLSIRWAERHFNELLQKTFGNEDFVLAADTDSCHVTFEKVVDMYKAKKPGATIADIVEFLDKFAEKKVQPYISSFYTKLADYVNAYQQKMNMKRENIVENGIYLAKKKYLYWVHDSEGTRYKEPKLKVVGLELVRSSTPKFCKEKMTEACKICLTKTEADLIEYVNQVKKEFFALPYEEVAIPTGVKEVQKYTDKSGGYVKGTPIHVRASILHNQMIKNKNLGNIYETIKDGDKIKYSYLKLPNPLFENVVGTLYDLPKEFALEPYIDYDQQFDRGFRSAVNRICEAIGWDLEKKETLEDFWS